MPPAEANVLHVPAMMHTYASTMELGLGSSYWIGFGSYLLGSLDFWVKLGLGLMGYGFGLDYWIGFRLVLDYRPGRPS